MSLTDSVYKCIRPTLRKVAIPTDSVKDDKGRYVHTTRAEIPVACGHCSACRLLKSRQWASRLAFEMTERAKTMPKAHTYFVTLTYKDEVVNNGYDNENEKKAYRDLQLMFKRLRKGSTYLPALKFKYYVAGEFGEQFQRFHWHILLMVEDDSLIPEWITNSGAYVGLGNEFRSVLQDDGEKPQLSLHYINSAKKNQKRLQTGKEATLSFILQNFFWENGHVSVGSSDNLGGAHYVTKTLRYVTKTRKEDRQKIEDDKRRDFHRQSLDLGVLRNDDGSLRSLCGVSVWDIFQGVTIMPMQPKHNNSCDNAIVPIPRYWVRLHCNEEKRIANLPFLCRKAVLEFALRNGADPSKVPAFILDEKLPEADNYRMPEDPDDMPADIYMDLKLFNRELPDLPFWTTI